MLLDQSYDFIVPSSGHTAQRHDFLHSSKKINKKITLRLSNIVSYVS